MGVRVLRSGTRVPKGGFAAAKHPSIWGHSCEIKKISALALCGSSSNGYNFLVSNLNHAPFEDERTKLSGNFAAETPFGRVIRSCETTLWHTSATLQHPYAHFAAAKWAAKIPLLRKIHPLLQKCFKLKKWATKFPFCCQMISKLRNGYKMISKVQNGYKMIFKLQNGYENATGIKMGCEIPIWLRNVFATP